MLHNINLATLWPSNIFIIRPQHPERRPNALPNWNLNSCLYFPGLNFFFVIAYDAGRSVIPIIVSRCNFQGTIANFQVRRGIGIILQFIVSPTTVA